MDSQQTPITNPCLDDSVLPAQPASDWAQSTESALGSTTAPAAPTSSHVIQPHETGLDTTAKPQSAVEHTLGTESAVSTPGLQVPGAWNDKPTTGAQILSDAGNALATAGSTAYNALPDSVKGVFSAQTTNNSAIQTTTNHSTTTPTQTASSYPSTLAEAGTAAGATAAGGAALAYEKASNAMSSSTTGPTANIDRSKPATAAHETASLPSQEHQGQKPPSGPMGGVGALPGDVHETGVAILPDDRDAMANKSTMPTEHTAGTVQPSITDRAMAAAAVAAATATTAATVVVDKAGEVYQNPSAYVPAAAAPYLPGGTTTEVKAGVAPHPTQSLPSQEIEGQKPGEIIGGVGSLPGTVHEEGVAVLPEEKANPDPLASSHRKEKVESKAERVKEKVMPSHEEKEEPIINEKPTINTDTTRTKTTSSNELNSPASDSPTKKAGFMDKLKGQSKIISGKMSRNEEKIAQGQAMKTGEYTPQK